MSIGNYINRYHTISEELHRRDKAYRGALEHVKNIEILTTACHPEDLHELGERLRGWKSLLGELISKLNEQSEKMRSLFKEARASHPRLNKRTLSRWR